MSTFSSLEDASSPDLPQDILDHLPQADAAAQANLAKVEQELGTVVRGINRQAMLALGPATPPKQRLVRLRFLAGQWSSAYVPNAACRLGCSHCCKVDVAVPREEAQLIAKATGARLHEPRAVFSAEETSSSKDFFGQTCPFLVAGNCSIYADRPLACRTLVNLDSDARLCVLRPGVEVPVPYANATTLQAAFVRVAIRQDWADIREWFPLGLRRAQSS